ncbi:MAG: hypothetical protein ACFFB0_16900 [Promethearchaeota archaeon]
MVKKGKYKLFSYIVDGFLIYYKSFNNYNKFMAFAVIESKSFNPIILSLNEFLRQRFIHYYSIQIYTTTNEKLTIILNFEDKEKDGIIKTFHIIHQNLAKYKKSIKFMENSTLERLFLGIISEEINSNKIITEKSGTLLIKNEKKLSLLDFYKINLLHLENKNSFIDSFSRLIQNYSRAGYLIFNIHINFTEEIQIYPYFVEVYDKVNHNSDIIKIVNSFFNVNLIKKRDVKTNNIFDLLWRIRISDDSYPLTLFYNLFLTKEQYFLPPLLKFNSEFEQNLINNKIRFTRLSNKLFLIEQVFIVVILPTLESNYIQRLIKKYYLKYYIYLLIWNKIDYEKLSQIQAIDKLKNFEIIFLNNISNFDLTIFKDIN